MTVSFAKSSNYVLRSVFENGNRIFLREFFHVLTTIRLIYLTHFSGYRERLGKKKVTRYPFDRTLLVSRTRVSRLHKKCSRFEKHRSQEGPWDTGRRGRVECAEGCNTRGRQVRARNEASTHRPYPRAFR